MEKTSVAAVSLKIKVNDLEKLYTTATKPDDKSELPLEVGVGGSVPWLFAELNFYGRSEDRTKKTHIIMRKNETVVNFDPFPASTFALLARRSPGRYTSSSFRI